MQRPSTRDFAELRVLDDNLLLVMAMLCLIVGPTLIVYLLYRRAEKRRQRGEEARRKRGRVCDRTR
jgi:hypothetical protein